MIFTQEQTLKPPLKDKTGHALKTFRNTWRLPQGHECLIKGLWSWGDRFGPRPNLPPNSPIPSPSKKS